MDHSAQAHEKWRQSLKQRNLDRTKASWITPSTAYCYKMSLGWWRGITDFWVAFPGVLGSISLMEQRHPCREATNVAIATLVEPALTIAYICALVRIKSQGFYLLLYHSSYEAPWSPKNKPTKPSTLFPWPDTVSPKERVTCACADGLLSKRPLWFVKLTPGEWDKEEFHPQAEWAIPQVSSRPLLQRQFPEEGESELRYTCCVWPNSYSQALSSLITLLPKGQTLAKEYPALSFASS